MSALRLVGLALSAALIHLVLVQPNHPAALGWGTLRLVPLELPVLLLGLLVAGRRGGPLALVASLALTAMVALKFADFGAYTAFGRRFDPVVDLHLVAAGLQLLAGSIGRAGAGLAIGAGLVALAGLGWAIFAGLRLWSRTGSRLGRPLRGVAGAVTIVFAALSAAEIRTALGGWQGWNPPGTAFTARLAAEHLRDFGRSRAALAEFASATAADPWAARSGLLDRLGGRDVVIAFVESYGRAAFDNPLYAERHHRTLAAGAAALAEAGLAMRSGWLASPVRGGQSWLAHATLASGLPVGDERRYRAMLASPRRTLFDLAAAAGYRTLAVAPAIVMAWPEASQMGFQRILAAADLGYAGPPFNWVTMPDQYTLAAFDRLAPEDSPLMAEIALISSHAPWTPVPDLRPWDRIEDGRGFAGMAAAGPSPAEVWSDRDRIRDHYGRALDYAVRTVLSWAALPRDRPPLLVVLGDHQPAGFVAQAGGRDVPVHLIGPPEVLALFDGWGWSDGPVPDADRAPWPMSAFRDRFLAATAGPAETTP